MRRTTGLIMLVLLACGCAWGQKLTSIAISTVPSGPLFQVDGTGYTTPQVFEWPVGSKHVVVFPLSVNPTGDTLGYQNPSGDNVRYTFGSWVDNIGLLTPSSAPVQIVTADPKLTSLIAVVTVKYRVRINFSNSGATLLNGNCTGAPGNAPQDGLRYGIIYFDTFCVGDTTDFYVDAGLHRLNAFPYPGWVFYGFLINTLPPDYLTTVNVTTPLNITPLFSIAKRLNLITNPLGLRVLVDGAAINTSPAGTVAASGTGCASDYTRLPVGAPAGFIPLCWGQFDLLPGSKHRLGAPVPQQDAAGKYWIFSGFSNGLKQNDVYTADTNTGAPDTVVANFVPGVHISILSNPGGLPLQVDGRSNWGGLNFIWGQGETHRLTAPAQLPDARGRRYQFMNWSNKGAASQDITIPANVTDMAFAANYQILNRVQLQSVPAGLSFTVDGTPCVTPCTIDGLAGSQLQLGIPASIAATAGSRYDFNSWLDGTSVVSRQVNLDQDTQILTAMYRAFFQLSSASDPAGGVSFKFDTPSPDSFYPDGAQVTVTAVPKPGFKFRRWGGDLAGTYSSGTLTMSGPHNVVAMLDKVPFIAPAGVQNAAGPTPDNSVAPGSIVAIFGANLAPSLQIGPTNPLSQTLAGVTVTVADRILPLFFVSPDQINAQMPSDLPDGDYTIQVNSLGQPGMTGTFTISRDAPGIFTQQNDQNLPLAVARHEDGAMVTLDSPARRNETVSIFGTGFGPYERKVIDGFPVSSLDTPAVSDPVIVTAGSLQLQPDWTGAAKNMVGMTIVKLKIIDDMPAAASLDVIVLVNGKSSTKVLLPVQ